MKESNEYVCTNKHTDTHTYTLYTEIMHQSRFNIDVHFGFHTALDNDPNPGTCQDKTLMFVNLVLSFQF